MYCTHVEFLHPIIRIVYLFRMCIFSSSSPSSYLVWDDFSFITTFATTDCKYLHLYLSNMQSIHTMFIPRCVYTHLLLPLHILSGSTSTSSLLLQPQIVSIYTFISHIVYTCRVFTPCLFHRQNTYVCSECVYTHLLLPLHILSGMTSTSSATESEYLHLYLSYSVHMQSFYTMFIPSSEYVCMFRMRIYSSSSPSSYLVWNDFYFITTLTTTECKSLQLYLSCIVHMQSFYTIVYSIVGICLQCFARREQKVHFFTHW